MIAYHGKPELKQVNHPLVRDAVKQCADVLALVAKGKPADKITARSAKSAAGSAACAAWVKMSEKMLELLRAA